MHQDDHVTPGLYIERARSGIIKRTITEQTGGLMIFEADVDQIKRLNSLTLVQLMKRLILAECRLADIPLRAAAVPLQITVADGGEDGRIEWTGGVDETDFFPARFCVFQSKAQNMTEALVKAEILKKQESGPPKLNEAVLEVLTFQRI